MTYSPTIPIAKHKAGLSLSITFGLISMSLFDPLMGWVLILSLCAVVVRLCLFLGWHPQPPTTQTINLLAILSVLALGWFGVSLGLLLAMVNLLVTACSLKLMVMRSQKDYLQLFLSLVFLTGCGYIFEQGLVFVAFYTGAIIALFVSLGLQYASNQSLGAQVKQLGVLSVQALPITIVFFIVFPQLPPLWKMPSAGGASTGISDTVRPGDIASLSQSSELAFRAQFYGDIPKPAQRYWRALVLEEFDGEEWTTSKARQKREQTRRVYNQLFKPNLTGFSYNYRIFVEPTRQSWLFTLDVPQINSASTAQKVWQTESYTLEARQPLMSALAYDIASYPTSKLNQVQFSVDKVLNLSVPVSGNPRTQAWVKELRTQHTQDADLINAILQYYQSQNFQYTLTPPLMQNNGIDAFLFDEQQGFCAHYASSMAYALRLAGIPARMVAGYQGGEMLDTDVISVYQYDAHAWVEAWFDERGWIRFDPTGLIAPNRLELGLQEALKNKDTFLSDAPISLKKLEHFAFLRSLRSFLGQMDFLWSQWVLGFDKQQQMNLFKLILGQITVEKMITLMLSVFAGIALLLTVFFWPALRAKKQDLVVKEYLVFTQWLATNIGVQRGTLPPQDYAARIAPTLSQAANYELDAITRLFESNQYSKNVNKDTHKSKQRMRSHIKKFKRVYKQK